MVPNNTNNTETMERGRISNREDTRRLRRRIWGTRRRARLFRVMMDTMDMEIRDMDSRVVALSCSSRERVISRRGVGIMFMRRRWVRLLERGMGLFARV